MTHIILASHGNFAEGVKHALGVILGGAADAVETYGLHPGASAADCVLRVRERADSSPGEQFIVVTDIAGGSVCSEFLSLAGYPNVIILSGMNLALALEIVMNKEEVFDEGAIENAVTAAREGIRRIDGETLRGHEKGGDF
ncbi:MAG: hypothetical protein LBR87_01620 [Synergistaceae bacterium]|nr:hypothetical protein [Synergistaceae bacterium]